MKKAHQESWDLFISTIENDVHGRQNVAYKIMNHLKSEEKDTAELNVIKKDDWIKYYKDLLYDPTVIAEDKSQYNNPQIDPLSKHEMEYALSSMKNRKAPGVDGINAELLKYGGEELKTRLLELFNNCWRKCQIPDAWKKAKVISLFKKGNRSQPQNYRGISLLINAYKVYTKIINKRLTTISDSLLLEEQSGFRQGRSCTDNVFTINQIIEKRREFNLETHIAFIDYEKAFDRVNRELLWQILQKRGYPLHLIEVIKSLYHKTSINLQVGNKMLEELEVNRGVRQGCSLSPTLFNIYIDNILREWKSLSKPSIWINPNTPLQSLLYADDHTIIEENELSLQKSLYQLNRICKPYCLSISVSKTKVMAFRGKYPIRTKIIIDDKVIEQVKHFNYLGCDITYEYSNDMKTKLQRFQHTCGTINKYLRNKTRKETLLKFYKVMAVPQLLYGCESWTIRKQDKMKIQASEMKFLRRVKRCTLMDKIKNEDIRQELNIFSLNEKINEYRSRWVQHLRRMPHERIPRHALLYRPRGRRDIGRPRQRWSYEAGTGNLPNP